jgi:hypothetical protein
VLCSWFHTETAALRSPDTLCRAVLSLGTLCRGQPRPDLTAIGVPEAIPTLVSLLESADTDVLIHLYWSLAYIFDDHHDHHPTRVRDILINEVPLLTHYPAPLIGIVMEYYPSGIRSAVQATPLVGGVVKLLSHTSVSIREPALRVLNNIATYSDDEKQIDDFLRTPTLAVAGNNGNGTTLALLHRMLRNESDLFIHKSVCSILLWITANGSTEHIRLVISHGNLYNELIKSMAILMALATAVVLVIIKIKIQTTKIIVMVCSVK